MKSRASEDKRLILQAIQNNDESAYAKLLERYKDSIYYMILKMVHKKEDAEDLTIEAFSKAFTNIHSYNSKYAFSTWLFKIAVNNCIDFIRRERLVENTVNDVIQENPNPEPETDTEEFDFFDSLNKTERKIIAQQVINQMPKNYKILTSLRYFKEYSLDEIALELNLPLNKVKAQINRGTHLIESIFHNYGNSYKV